MAESHRGEPADILLVEDNPGDVRLTQEALSEGKINNTLHVVTDGIEALDFLFQRNDYADAPSPDLVLLDLNLPRKGGKEVLREMEDVTHLHRIPVLILTSSDVQQEVVESYDLSANAYLRKPVDPDDFLEVVLTLEQFWLSIVELPTDQSDSSPAADYSE